MEARIQCKALRRGKNLAFSEDTCLEKERVQSKVTLRKIGVELKREVGENTRRLAWWGSTEKKETSQTLLLRPVVQSNQSSLCGLYRSGDRGRGGPDGQIVSVKRAADGRKQRSREITDEERKSTGPRTDLCGMPRWTCKERVLLF